MDTMICKYMLTLAESESISAAARKLFISQPALTKTLGRLEEQLGCKLIKRGRTPMELTPQGEIVARYAARLLRLEEDMDREIAESLGKQEQKLTIATTNRGGFYLALCLAAMFRAFPLLQLEVPDRSAQECENDLLEGKIELAVYTDPILSPQLEYMPLERDDLIFVLSRTSSILAGKDLTENSLDQPLLLNMNELTSPNLCYFLSTEGHSMYLSEMRFFRQHNFMPEHIRRIDNINTRYHCAVEGEGIMLAPTTTVKEQRSDKVVYCSVRGGIYRYVVIAKKRDAVLSETAQSIWDFLVEQRFRESQG